MKEEPRSIDISNETALLELARAVQRSGRPCRLRAGDEEIAVLTPAATAKGPKTVDPNDIWANYDPEKVRRSLQASIGAFKGADIEKLIAELREQRGQDSIGRPG